MGSYQVVHVQCVCLLLVCVSACMCLRRIDCVTAACSFMRMPENARECLFWTHSQKCEFDHSWHVSDCGHAHVIAGTHMVCHHAHDE